MGIFTEESLSNIAKTGNVWGINTEYDFKFEIQILNRKIKFERRKKGSFMGRHGGGWDVKFGFQSGSWKDFFLFRSTIWSFGGTSIRISKVNS